jgi:hypothetical protein
MRAIVIVDIVIVRIVWNCELRAGHEAIRILTAAWWGIAGHGWRLARRSDMQVRIMVVWWDGLNWRVKLMFLYRNGNVSRSTLEDAQERRLWEMALLRDGDIDFFGDQQTTLSTDTLNGSDEMAGDLQNCLCASTMVRKNCEAARWRSVRFPVVFSSSFRSTGRARQAIEGMAAAAAREKRIMGSRRSKRRGKK